MTDQRDEQGLKIDPATKIREETRNYFGNLKTYLAELEIDVGKILDSVPFDRPEGASGLEYLATHVNSSVKQKVEEASRIYLGSMKTLVHVIERTGE